MHSEVSVTLSPEEVWRFDLQGHAPMGHEAARLWLDEQFTALECEPLRASGKVLLADKVLVVAQAAGVQRLNDPQWGPVFAQAASAALAKPIVRIDTEAMTVTF